MSQENGDSRELVEKILRLERSMGFTDRAVTKGLEAFIERNLPSASAIVAGYADADHFERQRIVARLAEHAFGGGGRPGAAEGTLAPDDPIARAKGVGEKRAESLAKLGIGRIEDLLFYLPRRLEDRRRFAAIGALRGGEEAGVRGEIRAIDQLRLRRGMTVVKAAIGDGSGFLYAVWFNQPWVAKQLCRGEQIDLFGRVEVSHGEVQMRSPVWEPAGTEREIGRLVPIYPATEGVSDRYIRSLIVRNLDDVLPRIEDPIPAEVRHANGLPPKREALRAIHFPPDPDAFEAARRRLAFEELYLLQLGLLASVRGDVGVSHAGDGGLAASLVAGLSFRLTASQIGALREIEGDLRRARRMMRLLQGDVGSGKTLVALIAALHVIEAGFQVALMVPTEILAEQHAAGIDRLLSGLPVRIALLTGAAREKEEIHRAVEAGEVDLVIGTHALIQEGVSFARLGLVIIDEQHRFGVVQRSLIEEKGERVDLLVMSATPIPRTIALTLYGEFDVSVLDELPLGEKRITTVWVAESRRAGVYDQVARYLADGRKGYVILPLVEESEKVTAKAAVQVAEELRTRFPAHGVGLIHGRLSAAEKGEAMEQFRRGDVQLLVSTTVVEVGIDVLDADFMVIEHAERFGLSQLHQLRGRIGRAGQRATCIAVADARTDEARERLTAFSNHIDGFAIAEEDLRIRGPGDLLGTQQHGFLTQFRAVDLFRDLDLMQRARDAARATHAEGVPPGLMATVEGRYGELLRWLQV